MGDDLMYLADSDCTKARFTSNTSTTSLLDSILGCYACIQQKMMSSPLASHQTLHNANKLILTFVSIHLSGMSMVPRLRGSSLSSRYVLFIPQHCQWYDRAQAQCVVPTRPWKIRTQKFCSINVLKKNASELYIMDGMKEWWWSFITYYNFLNIYFIFNI